MLQIELEIREGRSSSGLVVMTLALHAKGRRVNLTLEYLLAVYYAKNMASLLARPWTWTPWTTAHVSIFHFKQLNLIPRKKNRNRKRKKTNLKLLLKVILLELTLVFGLQRLHDVHGLEALHLGLKIRNVRIWVSNNNNIHLTCQVRVFSSPKWAFYL